MKSVEFFANIGEHARMRVLYVLRASLGSVGLELAEALDSDRRAKVAETEAERKSAEGEEK